MKTLDVYEGESMENLAKSEGKPDGDQSCEEYLESWKKCKSLFGQFHHYYVYGTKQDCQPFKIGYENCIQWKQTQSDEAKAKLEDLQHQEHLKRTRYAPFWEPRTQPPENWNEPVNITDTENHNIVN
ncbi:synaptic plasticity regulator PANTS-like [Amphiura filiformis]|uniref:synaptic plasticity regulator PANTS-like n=1 Tax=Amphiura filiformis TaxID=82378 RepID=UPI003B217A79